VRTWETAFVVLQLPVWLRLWWKRGLNLRFSGVLSLLWLVLSAIALAVHLGLEHPRWQMGPAYLLFAAGALRVLRRYPLRQTRREVRGGEAVAESGGRLTAGRRGKLRSAAMTAAAVCGLVLLALPYLLPVPRLEKPTGPYSVGTRIYHWTEEAGSGGEAASPRELMVQLWYPAAAVGGGRKAPYIPGLEQLGRELQKHTGIPAFLVRYLNMGDTGARLDPPLSGAKAQYPVILFSHGWPGFRFTYHYLVEGLAAKGYVVAAIDHTGGALAVAFPDGHVELNTGGPPEVDLPAWDRLIDDVWTKDDRFVLDKLEELSRHDPEGALTGRLATGRAGVAGHSFGGDNALSVLGEDRRFKAGVSLDGAFYGTGGAEKRPDQAFLWVCTEKTAAKPDLPRPDARELAQAGLTKAEYAQYAAAFQERLERSLAEDSRLLIRGASHSSFSDLYLFSPVLRWKDRGPDLYPVHRRVLDYVAAFMDEHLLDGPPGELRGLARSDTGVQLSENGRKE
jgi:predicted dienelactone hydrolase